MAGDHSVTYFSTDSKADASIMCIHQPYPLALASSPDSQCPVPGRLKVLYGNRTLPGLREPGGEASWRMVCHQC